MCHLNQITENEKQKWFSSESDHSDVKTAKVIKPKKIIGRLMMRNSLIGEIHRSSIAKLALAVMIIHG